MHNLLGHMTYGQGPLQTKTTMMKVRYPKLSKSLPLVINKQYSSKSSEDKFDPFDLYKLLAPYGVVMVQTRIMKKPSLTTN
jgi:hypothetical protein